VTDLFKLVLSRQVRKKDLPKIPEKDRQRITQIIGQLRSNPRPKAALRLTTREEYRLRQGDYRILYVVQDEIRVVDVRRVGHRREIYR